MIAGGGGCCVVVLEGGEEECMKVVVVDCVVENSKRVRRDCSFVIRSRGRWGKCG